MRILLITTSIFESTGGIPRYNSHLCKALSETPGINLDVVSLCDSRGDLDERYLRVDSTKSSFREFEYQRVDFSTYVQRLLLTRSYDVCIVGHINLIPLILPIGYLLSKPKIILIVYGIEVWKKLSWLQRIGLSVCDQVWSISQHTAVRMQMANGKPVNLRILNNALDPFWEEQAAQVNVKQPPDSVNPARKTLLTVSRLSVTERDKGHASVIRALPLVLERVPDLIYDIVGKGDLEQELQQLAQKTGVEDQVRFHGYVEEEELHAFYRMCDVFVMPSKKEGFGYVYLEAMLYAKPVVTGVADAGPEVIRDNQAGLSLNPDDELALASGLIELLMDDNTRREIGKRGRSLVSNQYSFERFQSKIQQYLSGVTTGP